MQNKFKSNVIRIAFLLVFITLFTGCTSLRSQYANDLLENSIKAINLLL
jgi:hypothetical protein